MLNYQEFLKNKMQQPVYSGFDVSSEVINDKAFLFQRDIVRWALKLGKAALFEAVGLGKTLQALEWSRHVAKRTNGKVLILAPLGVTPQTVREGEKFGYVVKYASEQSDIDDSSSIWITNYERLSKFDTDRFSGVVLDESSILKSFTGKTKREIIERFKSTPYKLACSATPAPNDYMELGNHAEFLDVMPSNEMLSRWFINDTMEAGSYRLKKHAESDFWRWLTSWAVCISKPRDLGKQYEMEGYDLPKLHIVEHYVPADESAIQRAQSEGMLFPDTNPSSTGLHKVKRESLAGRVAMAKQVVSAIPDEEAVLIWCDTNYEADELIKAFTGDDVTEVRGSHTSKQKEEHLLGFSNGSYRILITKPSIAGFGMNWQHCHHAVFIGLSYSFEDMHQALGRNYRFGQKNEVYAHVIYAETEGNVIQTIERKRNQFEGMQAKMNRAMKDHGLFRDSKPLQLTTPVEEVEGGKDWTLYLGDCVPVTAKLADNSIDFGIHSPPFSNLYIYSDSEADMGNANDDGEFFDHYEYLIKEMYRITRPGRLCAVHCKDLPAYMNRDGAAGLRDFPGEIIRRFERYGWQYHSRVTIWKDPVIEMQRTKNHGLLHKNFVKESNACRQGMPDYLIVFRKYPLETQVPVKQVRVIGDYIGTKPPAQHEYINGYKRKPEDQYSIAVWQRYASPVWFDIDQTNVLNFRIAKGNEDEKHICLAKGSLVLTRNKGFVPIEEIFAGDKVLTHRGRWKSVTAVRCNGVQSTVKVKAQGVADLQLTPTHKLWFRSPVGKGRWNGMQGSTLKPRTSAMKNEPEWMPANETKGGYINLQTPPEQESYLSCKEWWIVGRWLGDGHVDTRGRFHISCSYEEKDGVLASLDDTAGHVSDTGTSVQIALRDPNRRLRGMLNKCGTSASQKQVPVEGLMLSKEKSEALLSGYLSADGHYVEKHDRYMASSVSRALLLGIAMVAQKARNVVASVYAGRPAGMTTIQGRTVNTKQDWILAFRDSDGYRKSGFIADDGAWKKVREIDDIPEKQQVWDIQVEDDESFTAEGCIVHNCPLQLDVISRSIDLWSNEGDTVFSPFAGIGSEGDQAIRMKRKFVGIELKREYFNHAVKNLKDAERSINQVSLFDFAGIEVV